MAATLGIVIGVITLLVSLFILGVGAWNLYLSHYREGRSEIKVLSEDPDSEPEFKGGASAIDDSAFWTGYFYLKIVNTGRKGAYISSAKHTLIALKKEDEVFDPEKVILESPDSTQDWGGVEIEPGISKRYRVSLKISPETDLEVLMKHDYTVIRHTFEVVDNKGSYKAVHETEMRLTGPEAAIENWKEHCR